MVVHRHNLATSRSRPTWTHDNPLVAGTLERLACHPERYCSAGSRSKTLHAVLVLGAQAGRASYSSTFNSAAVFPPCLRSRSTVSVRFLEMAQSKGVLPFLSFEFTFAPLLMASSITSK